MNESEIKLTPTLAEDSQRFAAPLQGQVTMLLLAVVILSGIVAAYFYVQQRYAIQDREATKQIVGQLTQVFRQQQKPMMDGIIEKLREYGKAHPDFLPLLAKYGYTAPAPVAAPAPSTPSKAATPTPTPATAPKK